MLLLGVVCGWCVPLLWGVVLAGACWWLLLATVPADGSSREWCVAGACLLLLSGVVCACCFSRDWYAAGSCPWYWHGSPPPAQCPSAGALGALVLVVTDRPSAMLCAFTKSALWAGVSFVLLGFNPHTPPRWQEWYLGSKHVVVSEFLARCRVASDTVVLVTDSDVLVNAPAMDIRAMIQALQPTTDKGQVGRVNPSTD